MYLGEKKRNNGQSLSITFRCDVWSPPFKSQWWKKTIDVADWECSLSISRRIHHHYCSHSNALSHSHFPFDFTDWCKRRSEWLTFGYVFERKQEWGWYSLYAYGFYRSSRVPVVLQIYGMTRVYNTQIFKNTIYKTMVVDSFQFYVIFALHALKAFMWERKSHIHGIKVWSFIFYNEMQMGLVYLALRTFGIMFIWQNKKQVPFI